MTMSPEQHDLLLIKGAISNLPAQQQEKIKAAYAELKDVLVENGDEGLMAFALLGAEEAAKS